MYWFHLINLPDNRLVKQLFLQSKAQSQKKSNWYTKMNGIFSKYGLQHIWNNNNLVFNLDGQRNNNSPSLVHHKQHWKNYIKKKIMQYEENQWKVLINDSKVYPKLRTYCSFKTNLRLEPYLLISSNNYGKYIHTTLRQEQINWQ